MMQAYKTHLLPEISLRMKIFLDILTRQSG